MIGVVKKRRNIIVNTGKYIIDSYLVFPLIKNK